MNSKETKVGPAPQDARFSVRWLSLLNGRPYNVAAKLQTLKTTFLDNFNTFRKKTGC